MDQVVALSKGLGKAVSSLLHPARLKRVKRAEPASPTPAGTVKRRSAEQPPFRRTVLFEALEPRLLLSADLLPTAAPAVVQTQAEDKGPTVDLSLQPQSVSQVLALSAVGPAEAGVRTGSANVLFDVSTGEEHDFLVDLAPGQLLSVSAVSQSGDGFDVEVFDADGDLVWDAYGNADVQLQGFVAEEAGQHTVRLIPQGAEADYQVTLDVAVDALIEAERLESDGTNDGTWGAEGLGDHWRQLPLSDTARTAVVGRLQHEQYGSRDTYRVDLLQGESLAVEWSLSSNDGSLRLMDQYGNLVTAGEPLGNGLPWEGPQGLRHFVAGDDGTYYLEVQLYGRSDLAGQQVDYTLVAARNASLDPDLTEALGLGLSQLGFAPAQPVEVAGLQTLNSGTSGSVFTAVASGGTVTIDLYLVADRSLSDEQPTLLPSVFDDDGLPLALTEQAPPGGPGSRRFTTTAVAGAELSISVAATANAQYLLQVTGAASADSAPQLVSSGFDDGLVGAFSGWQYVQFNEPIRQDQLGYLELRRENGDYVDTVYPIANYGDGRGFWVQLPSGLNGGLYTLQSPDPSVRDLTGQLADPLQFSFLVDDDRPTLESSQPQDGGELGAGQTFTLNFSEAMNTAYWPDPSFYDDQDQQVFPQWSHQWSADGRSLTITLESALAEGQYEMRLPPWALQDQAGNEVDTNAGTPEVDPLVLSFTTDLTEYALPAFIAREPFGSLVYSTGRDAALGAPDDVDELTFELTGGTVFSAVVSSPLGQPSSALPQLRLAIVDPNGDEVAVVEAQQAGRVLLIPDLEATLDGTWRLRISSLDGGTGLYNASVIRGAMVQREGVQVANVVQPSNHTRANAEDLELGRLQLAAGIDRLASVGRFVPGFDSGTGTVTPDYDFFRFTLEAGQSASIVLGVQGEQAVNNLRIGLYDDSGNLATGTGQLLAASIASPNADRVILDFTNTTGQTVTLYARARGDTGARYTMLVTCGATFDVGPLDFQPQPLGPSGAALGGLAAQSGGSIGTDLPTSTSVSFTKYLYDGDGFQWDIQSDGSINDGTSDAYDGGQYLYVDDLNDSLGQQYFNRDGDALELNGRQVVLADTPLADIRVGRKIFVPTDAGYARFLETFTNNSSQVRQIRVQVQTNLGSDSGTQLIATFSGDQFYDAGDQWLVTDDASNGGNDPSMAHVLWGAGGQPPSLASRSGDNLTQQWTLTLQPGETKALLHFAVQAINRAEAQATALLLAEAPEDVLQGLTSAERRAVVNFSGIAPEGFSFYATAGDTVDFSVQALNDGGLPLRLIVLDPNGQQVFDTGAAPFPFGGLSTGATLGLTGAYTVQVDGGGAVGEYLLQVNGNTGTPSAPQIVLSTPEDGDTTPGLPAYIDLQFDTFLRQDSVQASDLQLDATTLSAGGGVTSVEIINGRRLRFHLAPLTGDRTVNWNVAVGAFTGLDGQLSQAGSGGFDVDGSAPFVAAQLPNTSVPAPLTRAEFIFSEPLDSTTVSIDDVIAFTGPDGTDLRNQVYQVSLINGDTVRVDFYSQYAAGDYTLVLGPQIRDLAGNLMDEDLDGIAGEANDAYFATITLRHFDLVPQTVGTPTSVLLGQYIETTFQVVNGGDEALPAGRWWYDRVQLVRESDNVVVRTQDYYRYQNEALQPQQNYTVNTSFYVPIDANITEGGYRLRLVTDAYGYQAEGNEANNTLSSDVFQVTAPDLPDLVPSNVQAPASAAGNTRITIHWTSTNSGEAATPSGFYDRIELVNSFGNVQQSVDVWYPNTLAVGESVSRSHEWVLSPGLPAGNYTVRVRADVYNYLQEHVGENNNTATSPTTLVLGAPQLSDLANVRLDNALPANITLGDTLTLNYRVDNVGTGRTQNVGWYDRIYLVRADQPNTILRSQDVFAGDGEFGVAAGGEYFRSVSFPLPIDGSLPAGNYLIRIDADYYNYLTEASNTNNRLEIPITVTVPPLGNITVTEVSGPATAFAGTEVDVTWRLNNTGNGDLLYRYGSSYNYLHDRLYLANGAGSLLYHLGDFQFSSQIAAGGDVLRTQRVTLPENVTAGSYYLVVLSDIFDYVNEHTGESDNRGTAVASIAISQPPRVDLQVPSVTVPATGTTGGPITVQWQTRNAGQAAFSGAFNERIEFSTSSNFSSNVRHVGTSRFTGDIATGQTVDRSAQVDLPIDMPGTWYVRVTSDVNNEVYEYQLENNNSAVAPTTVVLSLPALPDLQVTDISAPATATAGGTVTVTYTVTNNGTAPSGPRRDYVQLQSLAGSLWTLGLIVEASDPIAAGASQVRQAIFNLPLNSGSTEYTGTLRARVDSDWYGEVAEYPNENNNGANDNAVITVGLPPLPDLRVTDIVAPASAFTGAEIPLRWTVTNEGTAALTGSWTDSIYLSADGTIDGSDRFLGSFSIEASLAAGGSLERVQNLVLPIDLTGPYRLLIRTDASGQTFEGTAGEADNDAADGQTLTLLQSPIPNLVVTAVNPPQDAFSGQPATIGWTVRNTGTGSTSAPYWYDRVYLSLDDTLSANDTFLGDVVNPSYLDVNGEYSSQLTVTLPQGIDANYRFIVVTDVYNQVFEGTLATPAEQDNTRVSAATRVRLTPPPDLRVEQISAPPQAFSGQPVNIQWTVRNDVLAPDGGPTRTAAWWDRVWMSTDATLDGGDRHLGDFFRSGALNPQETYTGSLNVQLPIGVSGPFYFIVASDIHNNVYEHVAEGNNTTVDNVPTEILLTPPPDLEIVDTDFAASVRAGTTFSVQYRVENLGATATPSAQSWWYDQAWLSLDGVIDGSDIALGAFYRYGGLAVEGGYDAVMSVVLPNTALGTYRLLMRTDGGDAVFETDNANNVIDAGQVTVFQQRPDLVVSAFTAPSQAEAGRSAGFSWTVANNGTGDTIAQGWTDSLWGSVDAIIGNNDDFLIGNVAHAGVLAPGGSYDVAIAPVLPFSIKGPVNFYLRTDGGGQVFESDEANNVSSLLTTQVLRVEPDLQVIEATATPVDGNPRAFDVRYVVRNNGANATNVNYWYDGIWLSTDATLGAGDTRLSAPRRGNPLPAGGQYTVETRVVIPPSVPAGNYQLLVRADEDNVVIEGAGESDNVAVVQLQLPDGSTAVQLPLEQAPVLRPDLTVTSVSAPDAAFSGQQVTINWTVLNQRDASGGGYDQVYLSKDLFLDNGDLSLGYVGFGAMAAGAERQSSLLANLPVGRSGPYYVLVKTDAGNYIAEPDAELNNIGYDPDLLNITLAPPADLVAGEITLPANATPGQAMSVTYTVHNASSNPAVGGWRDTLYLSLDDTLDAGDVVFGGLDVWGPVAANGSYTRTLNATVPGITPGTYKLIVRSDVRNVLPEANEANNLSASLNNVVMDVPALQIGVPLAGTLQAGQALFFKVQVGSGEALRFILDGPGDDVGHELFARFGAMPTRSINDANTGEQFSPDPAITVAETQAGTYYVRLDASPFQGGNYSIRAVLVPFSIENVGARTVGNSGEATLRIDGARFTPTTRFEMVGPDGERHVAHQVVLADAGRAYVTFDLFGAVAGDYDLYATRTLADGSTLEAELADSVKVVTGVGADAFLTITGPTAVQVNRDASFYLNYSNDGDADTMAPLMIVTPSAGTTVGINSASLSSTPLFLLGASLDGPMDLLRPGAKYTIPVAYKAPGQSGFLSIEARPVQADSTELVGDWSVIEASLRPVGVDANDWQYFWGRVQPAIGNTLGNLVQVLNDMVKRLSPAGDPIRDVRSLFAAQMAADLDWMPAQQVTGQLLAAGDGAAQAGVQVQLIQQRGEGWRIVGSAVTNADGSFAFSGVKAGSYYFTVASGQLDMDRDGTADSALPQLVVPANAAPGATTLYAIAPAPEAPVVRQDSDPELVVDSQGVVHMFWRRGDHFFHAFQQDGQWVEARPISEETSAANLAVVAGATVIGGQPGLVAVWEQGNGNDTELWAAAGMKDPSGSGYIWSRPVQITNGSVASYSPDIEIDENGNALLVFQRRDFAVQDDADLYAFTMMVDPVALQWSEVAAAADATTAATGELEPQATQQVSVGYGKEFGPYEFAGFSFKTGIEGTAVATLDDAACQTTVGLNAKGSIAVRVPGWGRAVGEGQARGSGVWNVDPATQDWKWAGGQIDINASIKFEIKDGLFRLLQAVPPVAPLATALRSAMNFVSSKTGGAIRLENGIIAGPISFEAKDLRWSTQSPFPNFVWPDSVGEMSIGGEVGLYGKALVKAWDAELSLEGRVGLKAKVYPSFQLDAGYTASITGKVMGWTLINGEWSDSTTLIQGLGTEADGPQGPIDASELIFVWDPAATLGTTNVYGSGAIDDDVATNRVSDSPMRLARAGDGSVVGVFARDGDAVAGEIGNRVMVSTHTASGWSDEVAIADTLGFNGEGVVTVLSNGDRLVVWSHASAAGLTTASDIDDVMEARRHSDIYYALDTGSGFGSPVRLASLAGSDTDLSIARGADGSVAIAWVNDSGTEQVLYAAQWTGSGFAAPTEVTRSTGVLSDVSLVITNGDLLLAWNLDSDKADDTNDLALHTALVDGLAITTGEFETSALAEEYEKVLAPPPADPAGLGDAGFFGTLSGWPPFAVPEECKTCTPEKLKKITEAAPDCRPGGGSETTLDSKKCEEKTITYAPCVVQPRDPNDIIGPDGFGEERWVAASDTLSYMIRFENAADATAPAQVVTVTQVLDEDLDPRTFRVDDFGFADFRSEQPANAAFFQTRIDRTEEQGIFIDVSARIDTATRTITWVFTSIDPETGEVPVDATKGFLQPNDETGRGDGFISYTIKAKRTVETGTVIDAEARIVFDTQGPIDTPPIFNTLDAEKPSSAVAALPATSESTQFTVSWSGTDDEGGSSIRDYDVYVKTNDGAWTLWLFNTTDTEGVFEGEGGNSYAFYSVARDNAGNVEAAPTVADASIVVLGQTGSISGIVFNDIDADGARDADEAGLAGWTVFLDSDADGVLDNTESSTVTDALGNWRFDGLQPGSYPVTLVKQADFDVTAPASGVHSVTLVGGDTADDRAFGVLPLGSISGTQFEDTDGDGVFDAGEQGVAGWTMFLDDDGDGQLDAGERSTVTAADGTYTFAGLRAGSYRVAQVVPEGWIQTLPGTASANTSVVTLSGSLASISLPACACGGTITTVAAQQAGWDEQLTELDSLRADPVFADLDGRGVRVVVIDTGIDRSHEFFDGRIVYQYDFADNDADATDVNGHGTHVAGVIGGEDALFGGVAPGVELIVLKVFGDDGSGSFRHLERALQWVVANADAYNIGVVNLSLGDGGNWGDAVSRYGLGDEFAALQAQSIISVAAAGNNYAQVNALGVAYPAADPAVLAVGAVWSGDFGGPWRFGNGGVDEATGADHIASFSQRDDELLDAFAPGARLTSAAIGGGVRSMQGTSQSAAYVSGVAALAQQAAREHLGRSLTVEEFRTLLVSTATWIHDGDDERDNVVNSELDFPRLDAKGLIQALMALAPANGGGTGGDGGGGTGGDGGGGTGDDGEPPALPSTDGGAIDVVLAVDEDRGDVNFGAFELASLGGTVFDDLDGDGVQDAGEAGIVGATVFVDLDGDGVLDAGEAGTTTGAGGAWSLTNLGPGTLTVAETLPAGWARTTVASHAVAITSGLVATGLDFGRRDIAPVAVDDSANVVEGQTVTGNVLDNDSDPGRVDNALLSVSLIEGPATGSLTLNADGSFSYTAAKPFTGVVSFRYLVSDGVSTDEGRADITVLPDGSFVPGTVSGKVFDDLDGDGVQDAGEAGIAGATVFLDADTDGVLDAGETSTTTGAGGTWTFGGLAAGTVTVADVLPAGWQRTTVASHAVAITSGLVATGLDFGRRDIAPVAVDDAAGVVEGQTVNGNVLDNDSDPGRADKALLSVSLIEGPATGSLTLHADGSFSYTAPAGFVGTASFRYAVSDGVTSDEGLVQIQVLHDMLRVQQFSGRHDGFEVVFSRPFASAGLDVGGLSGDVVVTNEGGQVVPGSLFLAADGLSARFLATGAGLADGVYQVKLLSGAQAWRDLTGSTLDGNADGTPGDHWLGSFTVAKGGAVTVGLADVARGPGQVLGLAPADTGLQLRLSNGSGVTAVSFVLVYDPALLGVATLQRGSGLPAGATFSATELTAGRISVQIASATALAAGSVNLAMLVATVPAGAAYGAAQVLDVQNLQVNAGAIAALDNDATHVAAFPGDLNGDRAHTNADLVLMDALLAGSLSRLEAYPRIDAALLGDANGSGSFDGIDSLRFGQALAGTGSAIVRLPGSPPPPPPVVTPPPAPVVKVPPVVKPITPPSSSWVTPLVSLSATVSANTSIRVTV